MYKLIFFVPVENSEYVKSAVFLAGAGKIGAYENCCWETLGKGQFKPMAGSKPFIGSVGDIERVDEVKVEMVCADDYISAAVSALKQAHPYEEPAYEVYKLENF